MMVTVLASLAGAEAEVEWEDVEDVILVDQGRVSGNQRSMLSGVRMLGGGCLI